MKFGEFRRKAIFLFKSKLKSSDVLGFEILFSCLISHSNSLSKTHLMQGPLRRGQHPRGQVSERGGQVGTH